MTHGHDQRSAVVGWGCQGGGGGNRKRNFRVLKKTKKKAHTSEMVKKQTDFRRRQAQRIEVTNNVLNAQEWRRVQRKKSACRLIMDFLYYF